MSMSWLPIIEAKADSLDFWLWAVPGTQSCQPIFCKVQPVHTTTPQSAQAPSPEHTQTMAGDGGLLFVCLCHVMSRLLPLLNVRKLELHSTWKGSMLNAFWAALQTMIVLCCYTGKLLLMSF